MFGAPKTPPEVVVGAPNTPEVWLVALKVGVEVVPPKTLLAVVVDALNVNGLAV